MELTRANLPLLGKFRVRTFLGGSCRSVSSLVIVLSLLFLDIVASSTAAAKIAYQSHCNSIVAEASAVGSPLYPSDFLALRDGFFSGGESLFAQNPQSSLHFSKSVSFRPQIVKKTEVDGILQIEATLNLRGGSMHTVSRNSTVRGQIGGIGRYPRIRPRFPKVYLQRGMVRFELRGFWSESAGKLCMVGSGSGRSRDGNYVDLSVVLKLNWPKVSNISTSLVKGSVESLDALGNSSYFDPIFMIGLSQNAYEYTLIPEAEKSCVYSEEGQKSLGLDEGRDACSMLSGSAVGFFRLEYGHDCTDGSCGPFDGKQSFIPSFMTVSGMHCSDNGRVRLFLGFSNSTYPSYQVPLAPHRTLVGEGIWNEEKRWLCVVGCRLLNFTDSLLGTSVEDCTIRLKFRFPAVLSIKIRSVTVGSIWSTKNANETGYFKKIGLSSLTKRMAMVPGLKYEYTQVDRLNGSCPEKGTKGLGKRFPDGNSFQDMRFDMDVKGSKGHVNWGYATPVSIGDVLFMDFHSSTTSATGISVVAVPPSNQSLLNISYLLGFTLPVESHWGGSLVRTSSDVNVRIEILAEGLYHTETGFLCMVGCRYVGSSYGESTSDGMDCDIHIDVQFSPLNQDEGKHLKGGIRSLRKVKDPLYFEPLEVFSNGLYNIQAKRSILRMDLEIVMILISLTFACVFIGLQLVHVRKYSDLLPFTSFMMLTILTLGYMIPLVLNFEAFFTGNLDKQNAFLWRGGWLEGKEVLARVFTMAAFMLQFRLLHLTWSARFAQEIGKSLWIAEKKAMHLCLLIYFLGGSTAVIIHWKMHEAPLQEVGFAAVSSHSLLEDLRSCTGLILDGFLFPQILFNIFSNSKDKVLAPSFYVGTSLVRLLPHAYDAYRARRYMADFNGSYLYAKPSGDLYSPSWDVVIPFVGFLFCFVIFLQQRFGGGCILPKRFRPMNYGGVLVVSS